MITAAQLMSPDVFLLHEVETIRGAVGALLDQRLHGAPVANARGVITGVVSLVDLSRALLNEQAQPGLRVMDVMSRPALTISAGAGVHECARAMLSSNVHRLVVVDGEGCPVGVLTNTDILRGMVNLEGLRLRASPLEMDRP